MKAFRKVCCLLLVLLPGVLSCHAQKMYVHDPVMIRQGETYHLYCTFQGIASFASDDMIRWTYTGPVFKEAPAWTYQTVPDFKGHIWAPDIQYHNGLFYLYYSVSAFEKNTSCIGVATNITLDTSDIHYKWVDHGIVVQSVPGRDLWNAIDPNVIVDDQDNAWMVFGSFWQGIKLVRLDSTLLRLAQPEQWYTVARRPRSIDVPDPRPGDGAIEAPFIFKKNGYYYLFVSFDYCCRGIRSDYKIMTGRSKEITGPYLDREGKDMFSGGGTLVLAGDERYPGLGHNAVCTFKEKDYLVFHAYDAQDEGRPVLRIVELRWDDESWPVPSTESELNCTILK
jgi:arabinan endo-1,5-alpha-L-arabinosidase